MGSDFFSDPNRLNDAEGNVPAFTKQFDVMITVVLGNSISPPCSQRPPKGA